jgi:hypothetical protein
LVLLAASLFLQDISSRPATPRQGSLIVVSAPGAVTGVVAGEPLHFKNGKALAAVPLSATDSTIVATLSIRCARSGHAAQGARERAGARRRAIHPATR